MSEDHGATWSEFGKIMHPKSHVLEGAVTEVPALEEDGGGKGGAGGGAVSGSGRGGSGVGGKTELLMLFRSSCGGAVQVARIQLTCSLKPPGFGFNT